MGSRLFYRDKPLFGLEISQTGLRAIALNSRRRILAYGNLDVDPIQLEESIVKNTPFLAERMHELLAKKIVGHLPGNRVALSVPTARAFTRALTLPVSAEGDLLEAIQLESEQYIPVATSELYIDYQVISRNKTTIEVLMCAVPKRIVAAMVEASQAVRLEPVLVEPAIISLSRLIGETEDGHLPTIIVDIGMVATDIAILDATVRVTGSAPLGGHTLTQAISKQLKISLEEAHRLKVDSGLAIGPKQEKIRQALKDPLDQIANEVRKVLRYYTERIGAKVKTEQVVVVGSGSNVPGIGEYLTEALVLPVRTAHPWQLLTFGSLAQPSSSARPRFAVSAGLAMVKPQEIWR